MTDIDSAVERELGNRRARRRGEEIDFSCPMTTAHSNGDSKPSASWNRKKGAWNCLGCGAGGTTTDLAQILGIHVETVKERATRASTVATYIYRDATGAPVYKVERKSNKEFPQYHWTGAGWVAGLGKVQRLLYMLPELLASRGTVYVVEGEKDVHTLISRGLTATTKSGGAKAVWTQAFTDCLRDRDVVLLPDNDKAGIECMEKIGAALFGHARSVKTLLLPDLPKGGDVTDWMGSGGSVELLEELVASCQEWTDGTLAGLAVFPLTTAGNGELFAHLYGNDVRFNWRLGKWLVWDRHRWKVDPNGVIYRLAVNAARTRYKDALNIESLEQRTKAAAWATSCEDGKKIEQAISHARSVPPLNDTGDGWDSNPLLLGLSNGVVNLATGQFGPGRQSDRITRSIGISYAAEATCPRWLQFLEEVFEGDQEMIAFIQRAIGYTLTGLVEEEVWFLCHGNGKNGKSKMLRTIFELLGGAAPSSYASDLPAASLEKRRAGTSSSIPTDIAGLDGKRFVMCSESDDVARLDAGRIKALTGGDPQTGRFMRQDFFTFIPVVKAWIQTNHLPRVDDPTDGFWRRVRLIPFNRTFTAAEQDKKLQGKLLAELPGILNWAIEGAVRWRAQGLGEPLKVLTATIAYRDQSDPIGEWKTECCIPEPGSRSSPTELFKSYKAWAEAQGMGDKERLGRDTFLRMLEDEGFRRERIHGKRWITGLRLRKDAENCIEGVEQPKMDLPQDGTRRHPNSDSNPEPGAVLSADLSWGLGEIDFPIGPTQKRTQDGTMAPAETECPCETICPLPAEAELDCAGQPFWGGGHCGVHHIPSEDMTNG